MALSNIFNEPRREITESIIGIGAFSITIIPFGYLDYRLSLYLDRGIEGDFYGWLFFGAPCIIIASIGILLLLALVTHAIGDRICNAFQRKGVHLRPIKRNRR